MYDLNDFLTSSMFVFFSEINSLKKVKESLNKTKNDLEGICKILGVSLKEVDATNISHVVRTCKSGAEGKVKEVDIKEG